MLECSSNISLILLPHLTGKHCADGSTALLWIVSTEMWMTEAWFGGDTDEVDVLGIPMSVQTSRHLRPGGRGASRYGNTPLTLAGIPWSCMCSALLRSKRNTPLTMVRRHWPVEGLQTRNPVGGAQGGMEIHLWSTHTHISSKGKSKTAKTHFLTSICIGPSRSKSCQNSIFFYMKRPNEHQC